MGLRLLVFISVVISLSSPTSGEEHPAQTHWIASPLITDWGHWGTVENCPKGSFVVGMQLKVEHEDGWKDDTGLNGIRLFCNKLGENVQEDSPTIITSSVGPYGEWRNVFSCSDLNSKSAAVVGFQLKAEKSKGMKDDTSANNLRMFCYDFSRESGETGLTLEGDGTRWGQWSGVQICRPGHAICGVLTQVDHGKEGNYDDTALNNVRAECCEIKIHSEESSEEEVATNPMLPDPLESAREWERAILRAKVEVEPDVAPDVNHMSQNAGPGPTPTDHEDEDDSGTPNNHYFSHILPEFTQSSSNHTETDTDNETLTDEELSEELNRLLSLNYGTPEVSSVAISTHESESHAPGNSSSITLDAIAADPISIPPEVVQYLESDIKDEDVDPDPMHIKVIKGSIITTTTTIRTTTMKPPPPPPAQPQPEIAIEDPINPRISHFDTSRNDLLTSMSGGGRMLFTTSTSWILPFLTVLTLYRIL